MRDAFQMQSDLDALVVELGLLSNALDEAANNEGKALDEWEVCLDDFSEQLQGEYDAGEHKGAFPGQDRLESMCRRANAENREKWRSLKRASLSLEKKARRASNIKQQIGGLQSNLKTMHTESKAPSPQWSQSERAAVGA